MITSNIQHSQCSQYQWQLVATPSLQIMASIIGQNVHTWYSLPLCVVLWYVLMQDTWDWKVLNSLIFRNIKKNRDPCVTFSKYKIGNNLNTLNFRQPLNVNNHKIKICLMHSNFYASTRILPTLTSNKSINILVHVYVFAFCVCMNPRSTKKHLWWGRGPFIHIGIKLSRI